MKLPADFISTITDTFGEEGKQFIANLPVLIDEASTRWELTDLQPVSNLSFNFVAFANVTSPDPSGRPLPAPFESASRGEGSVVLKIGVPRDELSSEIAVLRLFDGDGACRLIDADEEKGYLLLERLQPGEMLSTLEDDDQATRIAAEVMKKLWRPIETVGARHVVPLLNKFILLSDWFDELKELRERFDGGTGPFDEQIVERVELSTRDFFAENHMSVLMHGDFHHFNILSSERGWLVIDPKGVIGPACYEVGPLMINPWGSISDGIRDRLRAKRRVDILHEMLGFERERIIEWSLSHAVLSAWWDYPSLNWEYSLTCAKIFSEIK